MKKKVKLTDRRLNLNRKQTNVVKNALTSRQIDREVLEDYKTFIESDIWKFIKKAWYKRYGKKCNKCNSYSYVQLHHIVYPKLNSNKLGKYRKVLDKHFISLCQKCHFEYHNLHGTHQDMINTSIRYIGKPRHNKIFTSPIRKKNKIKKSKGKNNRKLNNRIKANLRKKKRTTLTASELLSF